MISRHYTAISKIYEKYAAPTFFLAAARLVELANVGEGQSVLDVGTGTGIAALLAAARVGSEGSVLGIDIAPGMLAIARQKASAARFRNVRFKRMDATCLQLPEDSFDSIISNFGTPTHFFPELATGVLRILKEGGVFCFSESTDASTPHHVVSKIFRKHKTSSPNCNLNRTRQLWAEFAKLYARFPLSKLKVLMREAGFNNVKVLSEVFTVPLQDPSTSLAFFIKGEWAEYVAISSEARREFRKEALEELEAMANAHGRVQTRTVKFWVGSN